MTTVISKASDLRDDEVMQLAEFSITHPQHDFTDAIAFELGKGAIVSDHEAFSNEFRARLIAVIGNDEEKQNRFSSIIQKF